ncbi:hypothetical protein EPO33_01530 [Patescibacteria group bacterium]|nr:MAG: hypothetical protein EPO33_01530 [Patescibacteria group bacterium]
MQTIPDMLREGRAIWGDQKLTLGQIIVRLGVGVGDLCRYERNAEKDASSHSPDELKKEMGNVIFSMIRWCDDLGYDPEECVRLAIESQKRFAAQNTRR